MGKEVCEDRCHGEAAEQSVMKQEDWVRGGEYGKTVFRTREAAEKALKEGKNDG